MLGHVVRRYLEACGHEVLTCAERFAGGDAAAAFVEAINRLEVQWCVNCIGARPGPGIPPDCLDLVNHQLVSACSEHLRSECGLVHASSDGVFSPLSGRCCWDQEPDAMDVYGNSKRLAEASLRRENDFVIRCSIVGPELGTSRSLMGWLMAQSGEVEGYANQSWNGVTSLEWAKYCNAILRGESESQGRVVQPASLPVVSKYELLRLMVECWGLDLVVRPVTASVVIDRCLVPNVPAISIRALLTKLKSWY